MSINEAGDGTVVPRISNRISFAANVAAIDKLVDASHHPYVAAWGKWLGFSPHVVQAAVEQAEADNAPAHAIQKIRGKWLTVSDIENDQNLHRIEEIVHSRQW